MRVPRVGLTKENKVETKRKHMNTLEQADQARGIGAFETPPTGQAALEQPPANHVTEPTVESVTDSPPIAVTGAVAPEQPAADQATLEQPAAIQGAAAQVTPAVPVPQDEVPQNVLPFDIEANKPPAPLVFTVDDLNEMGVAFGESSETRWIEISVAAQNQIITRSGSQAEAMRILQAILASRGFVGNATQHVNPVTQSLSIWQATSPKGEAVPRSGNLSIDEVLTLHETLCAKGRAIMRAKSNDYCDGHADPFSNFTASEVLGVPGEIGILIRGLDKFKRIQTFINKGTLEVKGESVEDALIDIINYTCLLAGLIESRKRTT